MSKDHLPKTHNDLVERLAQDLKPVRRVNPAYYFFFWVVTSLSIAVVATLIREDHNEIIARLGDGYFMASLIVLIVSVIVTSWLAIKMSVPGEEPSKRLRVAMVATPVLIGVFILIYWVMRYPMQDEALDVSRGCTCTLTQIGVAFFPLVFLTFLAGRLAPLNTFWTAIMISLSSLLLSAAGAQMHCCMCLTDGCHLAVWHYIPIFFGTFIIALPLQYFLARWKRK
ncbi:MAG: DUF1109 family protein [Deltaproteobacteria bacterium]|nr:DUF1109 family protein [Deltaproteobacteria bacterium]